MRYNGRVKADKKERDMLNIGKKKQPSKLDEAIDELIEEMRYEENSEKYKVMAESLETLYRARSHEDRTRHISADTLAVIAGNLAGIGLILSYEKVHVIATKALGFVMKSRI